jgi:hypothetical protein
MPRVPFNSLPDQARIWVFASNEPLTGATADQLLTEVDGFLDQWKAHGQPLRAARDWREDQFLTIGIDPTAEQASGCSIDGLFRALQQLERSIGSRLVGGGRVFYRDATGTPRVASPLDFEALASSGAVSADTPVFDLTLVALSDWRRRFEVPARESYLRSSLAVR